MGERVYQERWEYRTDAHALADHARAVEAERDALRSDVERLTAKVTAMEEGAADLRRRAETAEAEAATYRKALEEGHRTWRDETIPIEEYEARVEAMAHRHTALLADAGPGVRRIAALEHVAAAVARWHRIWQEDNGLAAGYGSRLDDAENDMREVWARLSALEKGAGA